MIALEKISKAEIKEVLINRYNKTHGGAKLDRELIIISPDKNSGSECYFLSLVGTPPKGYGIFIPEQRRLYLYDATGKRFKDYYLDKGILDLQNI